eukprot:3410493-Amphidinium_carterae.1
MHATLVAAPDTSNLSSKVCCVFALSYNLFPFRCAPRTWSFIDTRTNMPHPELETSKPAKKRSIVTANCTSRSLKS